MKTAIGSEECVQPEYEHFKVQFSHNQKMNAFKAVLLFSPSNINFMWPAPSEINELSCVSFSSTFYDRRAQKRAT